MEIKITILKHGPKTIPSYATEGSAGIDIQAAIDKSINLKAGERILIPTGFKVEIPANYEIQVRPRSGLAIKYGISVLNSPGTIDSDYRGEVKIILINLSKKSFVVKSGDRIAQMILCPVIKAKLAEVKKLPKTSRNKGGFGSTGK